MLKSVSQRHSKLKQKRVCYKKGRDSKAQVMEPNPVEMLPKVKSLMMMMSFKVDKEASLEDHRKFDQYKNERIMEWDFENIKTKDDGLEN